MDIMSSDESLWEDHHHRSSFLPNSNLVDFDFVSLIHSDIAEHPYIVVIFQGVDSEGIFYKITQTIAIDTSINPRIVEDVHVGNNCSVAENENYQALFKEFPNFFLEVTRNYLGLIHQSFYMRSILT